ncbi:MAG: ABC transporter permease [Planctomycetes bacterium]|nr:ABC transporter permease [Planctomycetota bacterium]
MHVLLAEPPGPNLAPYIVAVFAVVLLRVGTRLRDPAPKVLLPLAAFVLFVCAWQVAADLARYELRDKEGNFLRMVEVFPAPWATLVGMREPFTDGTLLRYAVASLYRVAAGFVIAAGIGIPLGLWAGWHLRGFQAINPLIQALRPISPIAWIPIAILWFGVKDASAIFLIALSSFFPIVTGAMTAVRTIPVVYVRSAQNFGLTGSELFRRVVLPAAMPQIITALRFALGIAWMVIVAAEMIAVDSGLGYLVMDARNANYYDRVVGAMITIGIIGILLDLGMRRLELLDEVRWGFPSQREEVVEEAARPRLDAERERTETAVAR